MNNHRESHKYYLGEVIKLGNNEEIQKITENDLHYGWNLGQFFVEGYTRVLRRKDEPPVFLKNVGDTVALRFHLQQNIKKLNGNDALQISEGGVAKADSGLGTLRIQFTNYQNFSEAPTQYSDYLLSLVVGANNSVELFEEGDYEITLDYKVKKAHLNIENIPFINTSMHTISMGSNYRIQFKFSVRNGNCMCFLCDAQTNEELLTSIAPNGFFIDLTKSRYLDIDVKREILLPNSNKLDIRFNRPAQDGDIYTEDGLYTITIRNRYTEEHTTKIVYVGTDDVLKQYASIDPAIATIRKQLAQKTSGINQHEINTVKKDEISDNAIFNDSETLQSIRDSIYAGLEETFLNDDYLIKNIVPVYVSKEYLEELNYNSKNNVYFGYSLSELNNQFIGTKYVFQVGTDGNTVVRKFEISDDTFKQVVKNVGVGSGAILVCVTISAVTGGIAPTISTIFAMSAKTGVLTAISSGLVSGLISGIVKGIKTSDFNEAIKTAALTGSKGFKWGAIAGCVIGGITGAIENKIPSYSSSEADVLQKYGGDSQLSYLNRKMVAYKTAGSVRPDIVRVLKSGDLEAIEVKNYDLKTHLSELCNILRHEVTTRKAEMPLKTLQRIVLDVRGRGYTPEFLENVKQTIQSALGDIYKDIPIDFFNKVNKLMPF